MSWRRTAAGFGVALAAAATIATSPKRWSFDAAKSGTFVLDDAHPKGSVNVTVHATHLPTIDVSGGVTWPATSSGELRVTVRPKDGTPPVGHSVGRTYDGGVVQPRTPFAKSLPVVSCSAGCSPSYTIEFERVNGAGERLELTWTIRAEVRGLGDEPPGAGVGVRIDPSPSGP